MGRKDCEPAPVPLYCTLLLPCLSVKVALLQYQIKSPSLITFHACCFSRFCAQLTVYETLYFTAMLRLPRSWTKERKLERVEMVLTILGLQKCRDTVSCSSPTSWAVR